uniref:3'-5' exonuclease domain-containing protein n=1 Tax=Glossina brevipalpis TaxID=37001 RepID=A0A3F2Z3G4_9MUSC
MHPIYFRIALDNVRDMKTNFAYTATQTLAYSDVIDVKLVRDDDSKNIAADGEKNGTSSSDSNENALFSNSNESINNSIRDTDNREDTFIIHLSKFELNHLQRQVADVVYIIQTDRKYHKALADIKTELMIGLIIEPVESCRNQKTSLIAVSTATNVYIFDIINLGKVAPDFGCILESKYPRKVVHNSHKIVDHLQHRQNVNLSGIFDTFVAYCLVTGDKTYRSLEETIQETLHMPLTYFNTEETERNPLKPYKRPLTKASLSLIAKKASLQLKIGENLLHKRMLKNFFLQCEQLLRA